ncbi:hypothetical protein CRYUN_Cryun40dG0058300 [Craigia yunnanensis]
MSCETIIISSLPLIDCRLSCHNGYCKLVFGGAVLLAASAQNRCTALVCSCYVPSRNLDSKGEEINNRSSSSNIKKRSAAGKNIKDGVMKEVGNNDELQLGQDRISNGGSSNSRCSNSGTNGPHIELIPTRKSSLKKTTIVDQKNQLKTERRKVSWPDAHGNDIAHVQEFEPSVSDDGELEGVRNSCVCPNVTGSEMQDESKCNSQKYTAVICCIRFNKMSQS